MLEKQIEKRLGAAVKKAGGMSLKWISSVTGVPDRIVLLPNQPVLFVELKTATGVLSPRQKLVFEQLADLGHQVFVLNSTQAVDSFIEEHT